MRNARNGGIGWAAAVRRYARAAGAAMALALVLAAILPAPNASAQAMWVERAQIVDALAARYDERPTALGITEDGAVIELFEGAGGATWTLVVTLPNGFSRIVAAGEDWVALPPPVKGHTS